MTVVLREHWATVERGFAERYSILDLPSTFDGDPIGYRKFLTLAAPLIPYRQQAAEIVEQVESDESSPYGDWKAMLPLPLPRPSNVVSLDDFVASGG